MTSIMKRIVQTYTCCETKLGRLSCLAIFLALSVLGGCSNGEANAEGVLSAGVATKGNMSGQDGGQISNTSSSWATDVQAEARAQNRTLPEMVGAGDASNEPVAGERAVGEPQGLVQAKAPIAAQTSTQPDPDSAPANKIPESAKANSQLVSGPLPAAYLRPASAFLKERGALGNQATLYRPKRRQQLVQKPSCGSKAERSKFYMTKRMRKAGPMQDTSLFRGPILIASLNTLRGLALTLQLI